MDLSVTLITQLFKWYTFSRGYWLVAVRASIRHIGVEVSVVTTFIGFGILSKAYIL